RSIFLKNPKNQKEKASLTSNINTSTQPERKPGGEKDAQAAAREAAANGAGDHGTDGAGGSLSTESRPRGGFQLHLRSVRAAVLRGQRSARHRPGDTVPDAAGGVSVRDQVRG